MVQEVNLRSVTFLYSAILLRNLIICMIFFTWFCFLDALPLIMLERELVLLLQTLTFKPSLDNLLRMFSH